MAYALRRGQKIKGFSISKRFVSSPAVSLNDEIVGSFESHSTTKTSRTIPNNALNTSRNTPSQLFLNSLSESYFAPTVKTGTTLPKNEVIKRELCKLVELRQFDTLIDLFLKLTSRAESSLWSSILTSQELSYFIRDIIKHQIKLINQAADHKISLRSDTKIKSKLAEARRFREKIRKLYGNLIYSDGQSSIYAVTMRSSLYNSNDLTGYKLSVTDYENLIMLELYNKKIDLASKWFQRFEQQYPQGQHYELMTYNMWVLKFQVYCGGSPFLWKIPQTDLYANYYNPRKSAFKSETSWLEVFTEFLKNHGKSSNTAVISDKLNETLIYSIGYARNLDYLTKYIESIWGITPDGNVSENFTILKSDDPKFPSLNTLKAMVISLSYNQEFFQAMTYVNAFQKIYGDSIDLSSAKAKNFWDSTFKWCDISTKFDEERALSYYIKQTTDTSTRNKKKPSLKEAQENADFDYEGFLLFISELKSKRSTTMVKLWELHKDTNTFFSPKSYKVYLNYLFEDQTEEKLYDVMSLLAKQYHYYHVSKNSFNKIHLTTNKLNDTDESVYSLYNTALRELINVKWKAGYAGQCQPLIDEWALNQQMHNTTSQWFKDTIMPQYRVMMENKREEVMIKQKTEDDEKLLDLF
jgi:ATPase expression protein 2